MKTLPTLVALVLGAIPLASSTAQSPDSARAFLQSNTRTSGVVSVPGIQYVVLQSGPASGAHPTRTSAIKVRYEGRYLDGSMFDNSYKSADSTTVFPLKVLIPGFVAAVQMMRAGDRWKVWIPAELAYGLSGGTHPRAGRLLVFTIELVDWAELPPQPSPVLKELPAKS